MVYNKKNSIPQISQYKISNNAFIYSKGERLREKTLFYNAEKTNIENVADFYFLYNKVIFNIWTNTTDSFIYYNSQIEKLDGVYLEFIKDNYIVFDNQSNFSYYNYELKLLFNSNFKFEILLSDFNIGFYVKNNEFLVKSNIDNNNVYWQLPLSELGSDPYDANASDDIKEILGVVGNNLWFYSRCGRLVAVDVESGEIIFLLSGNNKENNINCQRTEGLGDCYFRESDKCIICISSYYFQVIDTVRYDIKEIYNFREQDPNGIGKYSSIYSPLLQGDCFTFLAEKEEDYGGTRRVGIFDYKARKLVWEHEVFTQEEVNQTRVKLLHPRPLKMSEDTKKLYILDSADTLHIFEREENV